MLHPLKLLSAYDNRTGCGIQFLQKQFDQRGFTGTAISYYKYEFTFIYMEIGVIHCRQSRSIGLAHIYQINHDILLNFSCKNSIQQFA